MSWQEKKITLLGIGGAGCRILSCIADSPAASDLQMLALDTDLDSLNKSGLPQENLIQAGKQWRSGRGCGGDELAGQRSVANERPLLEKILTGTELLLIVGGLGGGTCTGGLPVVLGVAAKLHLTTVLLMSLPFSMEGYRRRKLADEKIVSDLLPMADALITLPNDLLFSTLPAETPLTRAFEMADREMARTALSLSKILGAGNLFSADLASFSAVLKRRSALCAIGVGVVSGDDMTPEKALEAALGSPLLGGAEELAKADAAVFTVLGGNELSIGNAKALLELAERQLPPDPDRMTLLGAGCDQEWNGIMQLTILAIRYSETDSENEITAKPRNRRNRREHDRLGGSEVTQMELPNLIAEDKGIMDNTTPVIFNGEDLDIPAFKRRGMVIDCGK